MRHPRSKTIPNSYVLILNFTLMPPKADPYATPLHRRIDAFLCIFSVVAAALVFFLAAH